MGNTEAISAGAERGAIERAFSDMAARLSACEGELHEATRALERERRAFNEAQRLASVGSWSWDAGIDEGIWSAEMYRIFGRDPEQGPATSEELFEYVHPDDRDRVAAGFAETFGGGPPFELEYRLTGKNGITRTLHALGRRDPDRPGRYVGTVQDATELR